MSRKSRAPKGAAPPSASGQLRILAWDKLGFGLAGALIVVLVTGAINFHLEKVRSRNAVWKDVTTARFARISEIWERLNEYEAAVRKASGEARRQAAEPEWMARHLSPRMRRESLVRAGELLRAAEHAEERFWTAYHANRSYAADDRVLSQLLEHYRYVRWIYLAEEGELRHARIRLDVEERTNLRLSPGVDYITPAIAAAEARLDTTHKTVIDIQREVLRAMPDER